MEVRRRATSFAGGRAATSGQELQSCWRARTGGGGRGAVGRPAGPMPVLGPRLEAEAGRRVGARGSEARRSGAVRAAWRAGPAPLAAAGGPAKRSACTVDSRRAGVGGQVEEGAAATVWIWAGGGWLELGQRQADGGASAC
ncbi:unnamed protein product [Urochloa humidicola]